MKDIFDEYDDNGTDKSKSCIDEILKDSAEKVQFTKMIKSKKQLVSQRKC